MSALDGAAFRAVLGHYPTGVALVTAISPEGRPIGMIVGSFTSVSMDPPLVAYLPTTGSHAFSLLRTADTFCINVLSAHQEAVCRKFASRDEDKWSNVNWSTSPGGAPILDDVLAWIECSTESITEAGDHYLVMGRVQCLDIHRPASPLLFFQGGYGRFTMSSVIAPSTPELVAATRLAESVRSRVEGLTEKLGVVCDILAPIGPDIACVGVVAAVADTRPSSALGWRIPLMAPFGEQYIAHAPDEAIARWMDRGGVAADERVRLTAQLDAARTRGWSMSQLATSREAGFVEITREYANGDLTPARERELRALIAEYRSDYQTGDVASEGKYRPYTLAAPVLAQDGSPVLVLRLSRLPESATGAQIQAWAEELLACTSDLAGTVRV
jgi:flavin reductase (DIM6/NTAB) family NADH-FMN oxidoreductase RutF/DNA-binding IclR family transcriptional regulator